ncbi:glycosyl hydrolase family 28-related protein [Mucilaginibacter sp. UYCu711]|uniref:glycosyl hydrolase family 28-related protein n=1 Tax=Mucilaginibacter sp. UYCu711 TaxID=3156339 RepID=UPI003D1AAC45
MKLSLIMFGLILLLLFSCGKTIVPPISDQQLAASTSQNLHNTLNITPASTSLIDTIVPATAVSAKKYGAVGDGVHDDASSIQAALNSESVVFLPAGNYIINTTVNMRPGVKLYGTGGAIIKSGNSMQGTLLSMGRYFYLSNADNSLITNIRFQQSKQTFNLGKWANACIYIINSKSTTISYNNFDFHLPYSKTGLEGIWVSGELSENTLIKANNLTSVGIEYAENGANSTTVDANYITHAANDGLSSHGNSLTWCTKHIVSNNVIENSGLMGIEDWGKVDGTIIDNNTINGVGKDPAQAVNGIGISAVGINTRVVNNKLTDAPVYYIESGGTNIIDNNIINDTRGNAIGIMSNFTAVQSATIVSRWASNVMSIAGNVITGCDRGIVVFGDYSPNVNIVSNTLNNPGLVGINVDSASPLYTINVTDNKISFNVPNIHDRKAFESYTSLNHTGIQNINLDNNVVTYAITAGGGKGLEYGFEIGTDNAVLNANQVYGNNIRANKQPVLAISGNTDPAYSITLTNNMVYGAVVNLTDFTIKTQSGNNF